MNVRYVFCAKRCVVASCACDERWASTAVASDCARTHTHRIPQRLAPPHRVFLSHPPASCDHIHCSPQFCRGRVREGRQQFERAMMHEHSDCHMRNIYARTHTQPTYIHTIVPTMLITGGGRDTPSVLSLSLPTRHASWLGSPRAAACAWAVPFLLIAVINLIVRALDRGALNQQDAPARQEGRLLLYCTTVNGSPSLNRCA